MSGIMKKWLNLSLIMLWGIVSFFFLAGEMENASMAWFVFIKASSLASFIACYLVGGWMYRRGMLPDIEED